MSKFKSSMCRTHYHANRVTLSQKRLGKFEIDLKIIVTPGPGSYRMPSDFGYYESSKTKEMIRSISQPVFKSVRNSVDNKKQL